ncbi:hypothetical protein AWW66_01100 [Micromonospora rosaria]|uniref:Major facilitator superfamily (MFS) profile domain-containing protein n=1 Tax=Micromonospora rosaria TaxID=47874 RepID=A0A136PZD7_9ACTN|nr:MFS transporter [Micromonospora rosaria]KXK63808.1 hypothetical protein AWW66_01100 [Micromonospora rosaria]
MALTLDQPDTGTAAGRPDRRTLLGLAVVLLATFMDLLDATIIGVALPRIQRDLFAGNSALQWIVAGYVLAFAVLLVVGGRLGDMYGRKTVFLAGVTGFTLASAACGLATTAQTLIAARVVQGVAAAIMIPQVLSIIRVWLPPAQRPAAYMLYGAVTSLATVLGPLAGGILVDADLFGLGWRMIFFINVPVGVLTIVAAALLLPESRDEHPLRPDVVGVLLLTGALLLLLYPLVQGHETGWPTSGFLVMAASVVAFGAFVAHERARKARGRSPLVDLALFRQRAFTGGLFLAFLLFSQVSSFFFVFVIFLQTGLGHTPLRAGLTLLWWSVGVVVAGAVAVRFAPLLGRRLLTIGAALTATGMAGMSLTLHLTGPAVSGWVVGPAMVVTALGVGAITPVLMDTVIAGVPAREAGAASGIINTMMQVGAAVGIAVVGAVFFSVLSAGAADRARPLEPALRSGVAGTELVATADQAEVTRLLHRCAQEQVDTRNSFLPPPACLDVFDRPDLVPAGTAVRVLDQVAGSVAEARAETFADAVTVAVWYQVLASLLCVPLIRLLPARPTSGGVPTR